MEIWIDVEDASGNKYGDGPIVTATSWSSVRRLDQAGTFSFVMPAADRRAGLLAHKRIVRCWGMRAGRLEELGAGIIDQISIDPQSGGPTMLQVAGDDLLRELANISCMELGLYYDRSYSPQFIERITANGDYQLLTPPFTVDLKDDPLAYLYFRDDTRYNRIDLVISSAQTAVAELSGQYFNTAVDGWDSFGFTDGTDVDGTTLAQSGSISFTMPSNWGRAPNSNDYQVRFFNNTVDLSSVTITSAKLVSREGTATALEQVMALAPAGWSLDPTGGQLATTGKVYLETAGESVLATLARIAEQTGEHFALGFSGRRVRWLGTSQEDSGLRAIAGADGIGDNDFAMRITELSKTSDSYDLITRIYPFGGGQGSARVTLADANSTAEGWAEAVAAGYTITDTYLEAPAAVLTAYGRIDRRMDWPDVVPLDVSPSATVLAANSLFQRAYQFLKRACQLQSAYRLTVVPSKYTVWPGQTIRVVYDEWIDGYHAVAINDDLFVLETECKIDSTGIYTVGLTVATVDTWSQTDGRAVAQSIAQSETFRAQPVPEDGLSSTETGLPYFVGVRNGKITSVKRQPPVEDGLYGPIDQIKVVNGVIVGIYATIP